MTIATFSDLAKLSTDEIGLLYRANLPGYDLPAKKSVACHDLATHAVINGLTLADLRRTTPAAPAAPATDISGVHKAQVIHAAEIAANRSEIRLMQGDLNNFKTDLLGLANKSDDLSNRINSLGTDINNGIAGLRGELTQLRQSRLQERTAINNDLSALTDQVTALAAAKPVFQIDQADLAAVVLNQVTAAFGAFKSQVIAAGAESQVADTAAALAACQTLDAEIAFGVRVSDAKGAPMNLTHWHRVDAPAVDACFIWTDTVLRHLLLAAQSGSTLANVWLGGEKGAGKSETARQFAARTGRAFTRINFQRFTTVEDFLGATGLNGGSTEFVPGPFLLAYSTPGSVILLDEITNADPGVLNALNGFLEPGAAVNFGGKVWSKAPGVLILAADNTLGNGDQTGRYAGTRAQGAPLLNRFGQVVHMTFLPRDVEAEAVVKRTGCTPKLAGYVLDAIGVARSKVQAGEIIDAPSIRNVIAFIEALRVLPVRAAWDSTIAAAQPAESAVALQQVYESCISETTIAKLI